MKKQTTLLAAGLITLMGMTGCDKTGKNTQNDNTPGQEQTTKNTPEAIELTGVEYSEENDLLNFELTALLPSGNDKVSTSMRDTLLASLHWQLAGWFRGGSGTPQPANDVAGVKPYVQKCYKMICKQLKEDKEEYDLGFQAPYEWDFKIDTLAETDRYIVFEARGYQYTGGAHGGVMGRGAITFTKADGKPFTRFFTDPADPGLHQKLLEGIAAYFSTAEEKTVTPKDLADYLLVSTAEVTLPAETPCPIDGGLDFTYQQYEIAPYAAGMPRFTLAYDELKPYLTDEAKALLGL
ncbi:MAG: DUF3298 and DUF4163 domain-containing protein [Bacteroidaceae bacterium]|nr:DUF3298 and DUF4163 domain-containing protein [Bacteroidaceae bacterium]